MARIARSDKVFFTSVIVLLLAGFVIFSSASLGLLAREGASFTLVAFKQIAVAFIGIAIMLLIARIPYPMWRRFALPIFITSIIATILVFIPHIGFEHGGARRWISIGRYTVQPAELLKIGVVIYFAAWLAMHKKKIGTLTYGALPFLVVTGICGVLMFKQPDNGTFLVIFAALLTMYIVAGARWWHVLLIIAGGAAMLLLVSYIHPYAMARLTTFLDPSADSLGSGYQIQQALIAVGSGKIAGRGFGQSIQKFNFLPEPVGDSIFAVAAEEFGFIGSITLIGLFTFFILRGLKVASGAKDDFGRLLATGIVILIATEVYINIGSILGVLPLTGIPLSFVSQGGTDLIFTLAEAGIILNISKFQTRKAS